MTLTAHSIFAGEVYKWVDKNGVTHFGDTPPATAEYTTTKVRINSYTSTHIQRNRLAVSGAADTVIMYGTSWCGYCKKAKQYFATKGIRYKEYDIEKSKSARRQYDRLNGTGVPIILVGDQRLNGFSVEAFERIYN